MENSVTIIIIATIVIIAVVIIELMRSQTRALRAALRRCEEAELALRQRCEELAMVRGDLIDYIVEVDPNGEEVGPRHRI